MIKVRSEHGEQTELFKWFAEVAFCGYWYTEYAREFKETGYCSYDGPVPTYPVDKTHPLYAPFPALNFAFAIPNGGLRGESEKGRMIRGAQMKNEGVRRGVPDIFVPVPCGQYAGLFIEMKKVKNGKISPEQKKYIDFLNKVGYHAVLSNGYLEAKEIVINYFKLRG